MGILTRGLSGLKARVRARGVAWVERAIRSRIPKLVSGTAGLELTKTDRRELAPVKGMYGRVYLTGNSLPTFEYTAFDNSLMEFVEVTVRLALPGKILWQARTKDLGLIEVKPAYAKPFRDLTGHLARYFPLLPPPMPKQAVMKDVSSEYSVTPGPVVLGAPRPDLAVRLTPGTYDLGTGSPGV